MSDTELLRQLNDGYIRSVATSDAAWFDRHLAADFVNSNPDGTLSGRAEVIARVARPLPLSDFGAGDVQIRPMGEGGLRSGRA